jgi:molybdenum cofactor biosynthesis enzyme MoaA
MTSQNLIFQERKSNERGIVQGNRLLELHLYPGNRCNRDCDFCTVFGTPKGWYQDYTPEHLDAVLRTVMQHQLGVVKFYGGEPTLNHDNVIWAIAYLREHDYQGAIVIYSNGIRAEQLLQILDSDPLDQTTASLNYSITTGDGAPQMPRQSLATLEAYEKSHPGAIAIGHADIVDSGRGIDPFTGEVTRPKVNHQCPHCYPVLTSKGKFHACPFAIEHQAPHFQLGTTSSDANTVIQNFQRFLHWLDTVHEPYAIQHDLPACAVCWKHLEQLPVPDFVPHESPTPTNTIGITPT